MSFLGTGQPATDPFTPAIQESSDNLKNLIWLILIVAILAWLWITFAH